MEECLLTRRRNDLRKDAEHALGWVAVALIGYKQPVPRFYGDNAGGWPVRLVTTANPKDAAKTANLENPYHEVVVHDVIYLRSRVHAEMFRDRFNAFLLGSSSEHVRHGWREVDDVSMTWAILAGQVLQELELDAYSWDAWNQAVEMEMARRARLERV